MKCNMLVKPKLKGAFWGVLIVASIFFDIGCNGGSDDNDNSNGQNNNSLLNSALTEELCYFDPDAEILGTSWSATRRSHAMLYLTINALDGNDEAEARLFEHITELLTPGNEPETTGSLNERGHVAIMASFTLLKANSILWGKLTATQQEKIELIAKAELVACATTTSDAYTFETGLDGLGNFKKTWNPNFREASLGTLIASTLFFGTSEAINILNTFDADTFIDQASAAGLPTIAELFTYSGGDDITLDEIENAITDYTYLGLSLSELNSIYESTGLTQYTFDEYVCCGVSDDTATAEIIDGCEALPNLGEEGMCHEFNSSDGEGLRSSLSYSALGWSHNTVSEYLLRYFGYSISTSIHDLKTIGTTDLFYKAEHGYLSWSMGSQEAQYESDLTFGFNYVKEIWEVWMETL
ncbi:hypothetical protein [Desulfocicer niacini]